ncbi:hypothetical protein DEI86_10140 [Curtobacterium sp. MCBD17_028]|nr:hypothetical protein DEI86_10140 [Curtobacterium sp. MCBD17_028]
MSQQHIVRSHALIVLVNSVRGAPHGRAPKDRPVAGLPAGLSPVHCATGQSDPGTVQATRRRAVEGKDL